MEQGILTKEEGNKLIAEFFGKKTKDKVYQWELFNDQWATEGLKFHSSWDWLMPVVEKIESLWIDGAQSRCKIEGVVVSLWHEVGYRNIDFAYNSPTNGNKIDNLWNAVVQFIQWYNSQSSNSKL
jgi:hypothetical protein